MIAALLVKGSRVRAPVPFLFVACCRPRVLNKALLFACQICVDQLCYLPLLFKQDTIMRALWCGRADTSD